LRIKIDCQLFQDETQRSNLAELFLNANRLPHQLLITGGDVGAAHKDRWLDSVGELGPHLEQILVRGRRPELLRKPPEITLEVTNMKDEAIDPTGKTAVVTLERAKDLVRKPLKLWLENGTNDSAFLRTVAPAGEFRTWLESAKEKEWIDYGHGGGSNLGTILRKLDPWSRLRSWAMCDSDCWKPGEVSQQVKIFRSASDADPRGPGELPLPALPLQVLRRRAIENYLPTPALKCWANLRLNTNHEQRKRRLAFAEAAQLLDAHEAPFELRHHYHMEKGFRSEPDKIPEDYGPFREDPVLQQGMGPSIKSVFEDNLQTLETGGSGWLKDAWLEADGDLREEFEDIIESIRRRI